MASAPFERVSLASHSYCVTDPHSPGYLIGCVTNPDTGRVTAHYQGGFSLVLFEPLCDGCDGLIQNDVCLSCERQFVDDRNPANDDGPDDEPASSALLCPMGMERTATGARMWL